MVSLLVGALLGALALLRSSTAEPCPGRLECAIRRREYCPSGSSDCGPCLSGHVQDAKGNCEMEHKLHSEMSHRVPVPIINEDIDRLAAALANQHNQPSDLQLAVKESAGRQSNPKEEAPSGVKSNTAEPGFTTSTVTNTPNKLVIVKGGPQGTFVPVSDALLLALIIVCTVAGISGLIVAGICWCRIQRELKLTQKADYQVYGMTAPTDKSLNGDKKLAHSAQMYHYQHQKQQMISMEKNKDESKVADSATESDGENEDGDFTVYECPGLAPTGEMEVKNPLFDDSSLHHSTSKTHQ